MPLILPYHGVHPITQPFGAVGYPAEPRGWLVSDTHGPLRTRHTWLAGGVYHDHVHKGVDVGMPVGTPLYAPQAGIVVAHATYTLSATGVPLPTPEHDLYLQVRPGTIIVLGHLSAFVGAVGAHVRQGDLIAKSGSSGNSTGGHLHWEVGIGPTTQGWHYEYGWTHWNPTRMLTGGDLANLPAIQPA